MSKKKNMKLKIDAEIEKGRKIHKDLVAAHNAKVQENEKNVIDRLYDAHMQHEKIIREKDDEYTKLKTLHNELRKKIPDEIEKENKKKEDVLVPNCDEAKKLESQPAAYLDLTSPIDVPTLIFPPSSPVTPVKSRTTPTETKKKKKTIQQQ